MKGFRKIIALTFAALTVIYAAGCTDTATSSVGEQSGGDNQSAVSSDDNSNDTEVSVIEQSEFEFSQVAMGGVGLGVVYGDYAEE